MSYKTRLKHIAVLSCVLEDSLILTFLALWDMKGIFESNLLVLLIYFHGSTR